MTGATQVTDQEIPVKIHSLRWNSLRSRGGRFKIAQKMLVDDADAVLAIMGQCIVTRCEHRCEHRFDTDIFDYRAVSWQFSELAEGHLIPEYVWEKNDDGDWTAREQVTA